MIGATQRDDGWWSIYFEYEYNGMAYRDAIVLSPIDYINVTEAEIAAIKQRRFDDWVAVLNAVPEPVIEEPDVEIVDPLTPQQDTGYDPLTQTTFVRL